MAWLQTFEPNFFVIWCLLSVPLLKNSFRIALNKECPVAPPSPHQLKAAQLLSVLKLRKDPTGPGVSGAAASPKTPTSYASIAAANLSPEPAQIASPSAVQNSSSAKASALLSLLKHNNSGENSTVQSSVANLVVEESTSGATKSMQLLSLLKQVSQSPAPAAKVENSNNNSNNGSVKSNGLNHMKVHKPSATSPVNNTTPTTNTAPRSMEEDKRAELMMKLIKPRNTTVDDLLTDVDIAAKVKAAATAPVTTTPADSTRVSVVDNSTPTAPTAEPSSSSSKQDLLKNLLMKSKSPVPSTSSTPIPVPVPAMVLPSAAASSVARSPSPAVPVCAAAVGFLPIPTPPAARSSAASPVATPGASSSASVAAAVESATQRSADLLAAALRHSAQNIRTIQAASAAAATGVSPTAASVAARTPSASPVLKGMQAPVAWASLSSRENSFSLQQSSALSAGIAASGASLSSKGPSPPATAAAGAVPPRAQPVLISPSDLRNIAAASR